MTLNQAKKIIGNQPRWAIRNMKRALEMLTLLNTPDEWQRLQAAYIVTRTPLAKRLDIPQA
jgi:hypothetical protein